MFYPLKINPKFYEISYDGVIRNILKNRILKPNKTRSNYYRIKLSTTTKQKTFSIHRLVAMNFLPNFENKPEIDHKNRNKLDNNLFNLRWATRKEQVKNQKTPKLNNLKSKKVIAIHLETGKKYEFLSQSDAARKLNCCRTIILECCKNKYNKKKNVYNGYKFILNNNFKKIEGEIWKKIPVSLIGGKENKREISNFGRTKDRFGVVSYGANQKVDKRVGVNGKKYYMSYLVCSIFNGFKPTKKHEVNHIDEDPTNNSASNLEWLTHKENVIHSCGYIIDKYNIKTKKFIERYKTLTEAGKSVNKKQPHYLSKKLKKNKGSCEIYGFLWKLIKKPLKK